MKRSADTQEDINVDKKLKLNGHTVQATSVSSKPKEAQVPDPYSYLNGFGAEHQSEAIEGVLPIGQNNPQKCAYGLYAEQLSGTSFTTPRVKNQRSWLYRIRPTVSHTNLTPLTDANPRIINEFSSQVVYPNQMRWHPYHMPSSEKKIDFIDGLSTIGGSGSPDTKTGFAIHIYACNTGMGKRVMVNSDGDLLIVPQTGVLTIRTEFGYLHVPPRQIAVIQRGMAFHIDVSGASRGYVCEVYSSHFTLPDLGPIGANGLASPRDFQYPVASYEYVKEDWDIVQKFLGKLFIGHRQTSPFDVVGWHGNYVPYKYDLDKFIPVGALRVDHMDPSIFTVLTAPTNEPGVAAVDFVIFPPRWAVQENTFRPPYYHRNCMTEYMGNIAGAYDAKPKGFQPGAGSLHSVAMGHGPDAAAYQHASTMPLNPIYMSNDALAFMFESTYIMKLTEWAIKEAPVDHDYVKCWADLPFEWESHGLPTSGQAGRHNEPMTTTSSSSSSS